MTTPGVWLPSRCLAQGMLQQHLDAMLGETAKAKSVAWCRLPCQSYTFIPLSISSKAGSALLPSPSAAHCLVPAATQVLSSNLTALTCAVTPKTSAYDSAAGMTVQVAYSGAAQLQAPGYVYADSWLEPSSWPERLPEEGEAVLVPEGVTLVVNSSLAPLGALVVRGGLLLDPQEVRCNAVSCDQEVLAACCCSISVNCCLCVRTCAGVKVTTLVEGSRLAHTAAHGIRGGLLLPDPWEVCVGGVCDAPLREAESSMLWPTRDACALCQSAREAGVAANTCYGLCQGGPL